MGLDTLDLFEAQNHQKPRHICLQSFSDQLNILCNQFLVKKRETKRDQFQFRLQQSGSKLFLPVPHSSVLHHLM